MDTGKESDKKIGRFEVCQRLSSSPVADVYLAYDPNLKRQVVIKQFAANLEVDEGYTMVKLHNAPVVKVFDQRIDDTGRNFLVMEYMPNGTIANLLSRQQVLSPWVVHPLLASIVNVLQIAHNQGIVHGDIKPANIFFDQDHQAVVGDFGISVQVGEILSRGTPQFMAPEQWTGAPVSPQTDQYQLGVMLFLLLCGHLPYKNDFEQGHVAAPIPTTRPFLPLGWDSFFIQALAKKPSERFDSMQDLMASYELAIAQAAQAATVALAESNVEEKRAEDDLHVDRDEPRYLQFLSAPMTPIGWFGSWTTLTVCLGFLLGVLSISSIFFGLLGGWVMAVGLLTISERFQIDFHRWHAITTILFYGCVYLVLWPIGVGLAAGIATLGSVFMLLLPTKQRVRLVLPLIIIWLVSALLQTAGLQF